MTPLDRFDPWSRVLLVRAARALCVGARIQRIVPVERSGLQLAFAELPGLRLDTIPPPGGLFLVQATPARLIGGRGVWPDLVAAADQAFGGRALEAIRSARAGMAVEISCDAARLSWVASTTGSVLLLETLDRGAFTLPAGALARLPAEHEWSDDDAAQLDSFDRWWHVASGLEPDAAAIQLERDLPGLHHVTRQQLLALHAERARWRPPSGGSRALRPASELDPWIAALAERYEQERATSQRSQRRGLLVDAVRRERTRIERARGALVADERRAAEPTELRRKADALLAAAPESVVRQTGSITVPDPYQPETTVTIAEQPPGASVPELAARLYAAARKVERGRVFRAERDRQLAAALDALLRLADQLEAAQDDAALEAITAGLARLGVAVLPRPAGSGGSMNTTTRRAGDEAGPPRAFRSPGGFEVLVGRSARQNDQLTFRVAAAEDYWFHASGIPGAHVVLRLAGQREAPAADLRFAAGLAASFSQAPHGESVDVHVVRRKHLSRPKGGKPGQVRIKRPGTVLRVVAQPRADDGRAL